MSRWSIERRLAQVSRQIVRLRNELAVADEQLAQLTDEADEARIRSLVSETPLAEREHRDAQRQREAMTTHRNSVAASIVKLEGTQDELLDKLSELR